jgi:N-acetylglucosamine kinase-like BadF-type ATPase
MTRGSLVQLPSALEHPRTDPQARWLLGIDGGATKTEAAVLDLAGKVVHRARGGPSNEDAIGAEAAVAELLAVADEAIAGAGIDRGELARAVIAVAGTDTEDITRHVRAARSDDWIVVNDVVAAWATATGARPGVGAISGSGSNVFGVGPRGDTWRSGGWGHLLGDEGSGYWLGVNSIRAALHDRDGTGPPTALGEAVVEFFGARSVEAVAAMVYTRPLTKAEIASFAVRGAALAEEGDAVARDLYRRAAQELGKQITVVIRRTGLAGAGDAFPVGLIGSVFRAGPVFVDPLVAEVTTRCVQARVSVVDTAPVAGSLLLAARACGAALERDEASRLLREYAR